MGLVPQVREPVPAFIHVDVDDLWAIAECYGVSYPDEFAHQVTATALPVFQELLAEAGIQSTFFLVGKDVESPACIPAFHQLLQSGHRIANHSYTHNLRFRNLDAPGLATEIDRCHDLIQRELGVTPVGFRAPGYAASAHLQSQLTMRQYRYDASLMPSPFGPIFRLMDARLQENPIIDKTQYPLFSDTFHSLYPAPGPGGGVLRLPSAVCPITRLPFQAGVCMRLGINYFRFCLAPYRYFRALPFVFLFHAADLADFSGVSIPFFQKSSFFNTPQAQRIALARQFLKAITAFRPVITTEEWLES